MTVVDLSAQEMCDAANAAQERLSELEKEIKSLTADNDHLRKSDKVWLEACLVKDAEIERLTADIALLQVAAKRADNIEKHRDELVERIAELEAALREIALDSANPTNQISLAAERAEAALKGDDDER